ncbi:MAG: PEGA domain-containing protein, partial [Acidobacteria bacterium]|nr:PEGA domain-containing protein [Acidobacteriota bacterium]
ATRARAVPRSSAPRQRPDRVYVYPDYWSYNRYYYDPYYNNGFGLGYLYYSPWGWTPSFYGSPYGSGYGYGGGYSGGQYSARGYDIGTLKIKVTPRDAEVFVDGYFAGHVDDFDGFLQALKLDSGGYRIEVRKSGFETLQFDVRVQPDRNVTFRGELKPAP